MCWAGSATTTQSTRIPGIFTCRGGNPLRSAILSTWAITMPLLFLAAIAMARLLRVNASRSIVMLPKVSAVVPRTKATLTRPTL